MVEAEFKEKLTHMKQAAPKDVDSSCVWMRMQMNALKTKDTLHPNGQGFSPNELLKWAQKQETIESILDDDEVRLTVEEKRMQKLVKCWCEAHNEDYEKVMVGRRAMDSREVLDLSKVVSYHPREKIQKRKAATTWNCVDFKCTDRRCQGKHLSSLELMAAWRKEVKEKVAEARKKIEFKKKNEIDDIKKKIQQRKNEKVSQKEHLQASLMACSEKARECLEQLGKAQEDVKCWEEQVEVWKSRDNQIKKERASSWWGKVRNMIASWVPADEEKKVQKELLNAMANKKEAAELLSRLKAAHSKLLLVMEECKQKVLELYYEVETMTLSSDPEYKEVMAPATQFASSAGRMLSFIAESLEFWCSRSEKAKERDEDVRQELLKAEVEEEAEWELRCWLKEKIGGALAREWRQFDNNLPIYKMKSEILEALERQQVLILTAETGSGKSTQLPQYLFDMVSLAVSRSKATQKNQEPNKPKGIFHNQQPITIACTQPRRLAVQFLHVRVSEEFGSVDDLKGKKLVGYRMKGESSHRKSGTDAPAILFLTDGIFLHEVSSDCLLKDYSAVVIDEVKAGVTVHDGFRVN